MLDVVLHVVPTHRNTTCNSNNIHDVVVVVVGVGVVVVVVVVVVVWL